MITKGNDSAILKAFHTFGKETVQPSEKGRRKNSGKIPVQNTAKSRRRIKHRGSGASQTGRPTSSQALRLQLDTNEEDDIVGHKIPKKIKKKKSHPHNLKCCCYCQSCFKKKH